MSTSLVPVLRQRPIQTDEVSPEDGIERRLDGIAAGLQRQGQVLDRIAVAAEKTAEQQEKNGKILHSIYSTMKKGPDFVRKYIWEIVTVISVGLIGLYFSEIADFLEKVAIFIQTTAWPFIKQAIIEIIEAAKELKKSVPR